MTKKLLVLAASVYQLPAILKAREMGLRVITADNRPSNPGHAAAHESFDIDIRDQEAILALAERQRIDGIVSPCSDLGTLTAAYVASRLRLPGPSCDACRLLMNKTFRRHLEKEGLLFPPFFPIVPGAGPGHAFDGSGLWVLKPADSSGSKGSRIVRSQEEFEAALPECFEHSHAKQALLERFLEGVQGTCEGVLEGGRIRFMAVIERIVAPRPYVATAGHILPSALEDALVRRMRDLLERLWSRFGIANAVFDCDFIAQGKDLYILEMSPRLGGNSIEQLVQRSYGLDLGDQVLRRACGLETPGLPGGAGTPVCNLILGVPEAGALEYDASGLRALQAEPWVVELALDYPPGEAVLPFTNGRRRVGHALIQGTSREDLARKRTELGERLRLRAVPGASA
jgi:biotin carboxylase